MKKILLYYKYVEIVEPQLIVNWQQEVCRQLGLKGRVLIAHEGINGTLEGSEQATQEYINIMNETPLFAGIDFKESIGEDDIDYFPRLRVALRDEIVGLGKKAKDVTVGSTGQHLTPEQAHELMAKPPKDLIILDTRNDYESRVGTFKNAIIPDITNFRDFPDYIDQHLDEFKDKEVLMFCTGGVRCERATAYLNTKGVARNVMQIEGGIHRYVEKFPEGFFRGKNYVFDNRVTVKVNDDILGTCDVCAKPCDEYTNCVNASCNKLFISCTPCLKVYDNTCGVTCQQLVKEKKVACRPPLQTVIQRNRRFE
ncbi:rhodanese-related sulfurtransferase [Candidatus Babeliales bacterium]|nr:rhodanese-related sulfurtransferase [Candidatus Babeliales bacterium]